VKGYGPDLDMAILFHPAAAGESLHIIYNAPMFFQLFNLFIYRIWFLQIHYIFPLTSKKAKLNAWPGPKCYQHLATLLVTLYQIIKINQLNLEIMTRIPPISSPGFKH